MGRARRLGAADIAREAGVSVATVSRALNRPAAVQPETLARVRSVAERLGYVPNRRAQALVSGRSRTVGVVVPTLDSPIFAAMLQALQRTLDDGAHQMLVASHGYDAAREGAAVAQLAAQGVDGLIVIGADRPEATWAAIARAGLPLVQLWCGAPQADCVGVDNTAAGRMIGRHLAALGHRRIGVLCGRLAANDRQRARLAGLRDALGQAGVALPDSHVVEAPLTISGGRVAARRLTGLEPRPTALVGLIDLLAIGAVIELGAMGLAVPGDVSVAGIDNLAFAAHIAPSLTTVDIPAEAIGTEAGRLMLARLGGDAPMPPDHRDLPIRLILRASTGRPPELPRPGRA